MGFYGVVGMIYHFRYLHPQKRKKNRFYVDNLVTEKMEYWNLKKNQILQ